MNGLILGYGRAGQRWGKLVAGLGFTYRWHDPEVEPDELFVEANGVFAPYDFVVICTPPDRHLSQIKTVLDQSVPVLCEKPLCAFEPDIDRLLDHPQQDKCKVAYNYRYHRDLVPIKKTAEAWLPVGKRKTYELYSEQYRPEIPGWGLLLDHVSHTLDILRWLVEPLTIRIEVAAQGENRNRHWCMISGRVYDKTFVITDRVSKKPMDKISWIIGPWGRTELGDDPDMYRHCFSDFLLGRGVSLADAWGTQKLLIKGSELL